MANQPTRLGVRLGAHADGSVFEVIEGLHALVLGLAVVGGSSPDPEVMWEEHGLGKTCRYLELHREAILNPDLGPSEDRPDIAARLASDDERVRLSGIIAAFALVGAEDVNAMIASLREGQGRIGGHAWIVQQTERSSAGGSTSHHPRCPSGHLPASLENLRRQRPHVGRPVLRVGLAATVVCLELILILMTPAVCVLAGGRGGVFGGPVEVWQDVEQAVEVE
jgi:hypothetical protein